MSYIVSQITTVEWQWNALTDNSLTVKWLSNLYRVKFK